MGTIEKIRQYIKDSKAPRNGKYDATFKEVIDIASEMGPIEAVAFAFDYGRAKGYRAAKAEKGAAV
mgnify:FL=1